MSGPPPPPPPHGHAPRSSGLPPGKYDIFVIPEHSAGSGFLYLPSLKPSANSFAAGFASALILVALFQSMAPAFKVWWESFQGLGNMGITLLIVGVGFGAWALGRAQNDPPPRGPASQPRGGGTPGGGFNASDSTPPPNPGSPPPPRHGAEAPRSPPPPPPSNPGPEDADSPRHERERQRPPREQQSPPQPGPAKPETPKGAWERAREETRKKEEDRKAREAEQKRRDEAARRLAELRAREARERQEREKEKELREKEARDKAAEEEKRKLAEEQKKKLADEQRRKELSERLEKQRREREEQKKKQAAASEASSPTPKPPTPPRAKSSYAYSSVGEKTNMWPNGRPAAPSQAGSPPDKGAGGEKRPPAPTARTYVSNDEDAHSYRPYDQPRRPGRRPSASSVGGSEYSSAPSHTTARTSPPPSTRGPYTTKDPDKIVVQAVYLFMNQFAKTPASQLISGVGSVTDGLILRITTEGLFIDDDVRGVPQREWDVKAWTLKHAEAWCPPHCLAPAAAGAGARSPPHLLYKMATARRNADKDKMLTGDEADAYLTEMLRACKECCRLGQCESRFRDARLPSPSGRGGEWRDKGLHILRATIRDQEGKRYLFLLDETEGWKVAVGLQRLRRGTQVRQLGVGGMAPAEARGTLETLGWTGAS